MSIDSIKRAPTRTEQNQYKENKLSQSGGKDKMLIFIDKLMLILYIFEFLIVLHFFIIHQLQCAEQLYQVATSLLYGLTVWLTLIKTSNYLVLFDKHSTTFNVIIRSSLQKQNFLFWRKSFLCLQHLILLKQQANFVG